MEFEGFNKDVANDLIELVNSLGTIPKTATVKYGATSFSYVPLDDIMSKIKANGNFALMQPLNKDEAGNPCIQCILIHKNGAIIRSGNFQLPIKENMKPQEIGSVLTYFRRYCVSAFLGIASDEDNDGQSMDVATPPEVCEVCGKPIIGSHGLSPEKIIEGSKRSYGRKMCWNCCSEEKKKREDKKEEQGVAK